MSHRTDNLPLYQPRGAPGADRTIATAPRRRAVNEPEGFATYSGTILLKGSVPAKSDTYDPTLDVEGIYKACHGMGTDNAKLIKILLRKTSPEVQILQTAYMNKRQKPLVQLIISETSGSYQTGLALLASGALGGDAYLLKKVVESKTSSRVRLALLTEIVVMRSKPDLVKLKEYISAIQHRSLASIVNDAIRMMDDSAQEDLIEAFRLCMLPDERVVEDGEVMSHVQMIKAFLEGEDDISIKNFLELLLDRPLSYLRLLVDGYKTQFYGVNLSQAVEESRDSRLSPALKDVLVYVLHTAEHETRLGMEGVVRDARRIEADLQDDYLLTVRLVRAHWNPDRFRAVLAEWAKVRPESGSPVKRIKKHTRLHLETLLVKMIEKAECVSSRS
ncbi:SubName: Full=Uncharacterized protein {ECO:0000313/EMBL:CCA66921.1} [Serendipita indica DSM 11827]|uniref:Annexin n=1 Tax=Serendipita indica (strain DSM 11827) TaxID=1109443 RepID=G4T6I8_SERID|nr:SubName: Full=Uncharacterized protein {ECO:0000313/EMBL:CCA66921.1} [Serendipita indica DSM 11827]CCA66921.1 hypothetical protein PIIN_00760 [Serendipita indica DSM 11827]